MNKKNKKIYIATGNPSKLESIKKIFSWVDCDLEVSRVPDYVEVEETGESLADNSLLKVMVYLGKYKLPVLANDSGMFFDERIREIKDPVKVKRNALSGREESECKQEEVAKLMYEYYRSIARKYGGKINCELRDVFTVLFANGKTKQVSTSRKYQIVDREVKSVDLYHPLDCLKWSLSVQKYVDDFTEEDDMKDKEVIIKAFGDLIRD